ncbi:MAG: hypothetical protein KF887_15310 [Paracoccaceae bacterium]|nr:MAG: hypothetical protein KF887_15310 [Paracoccaceae bacterium]
MSHSGSPGSVAVRRPPLIVVQSPVIPARVLTIPRRNVVLLLPFAALTLSVVDRLRPPAVALGLFCPANDAAQVLARLARLGYRGRVLLLSPPLPDKGMVERELRGQFRSLRLWVAELPESTWQ